MAEEEKLTKAIIGKSIGIIRGLKGSTTLRLEFLAKEVVFHMSESNGQKPLALKNEAFNALDTNEIIKLINYRLQKLKEGQ
jgi:hypothetical protein|tara:strand:+ start:497 stop:739 length:243 start_codon:yes stop_codon:yes gene_type:complete